MQVSKILDERGPIILDGGLSNVLEAMGHDLNHELWTARLLNENPTAIIEAHLAYLKAGARIITTASYQASLPGIMNLGFNRDEAVALILKSVALAEEAIRLFLKDHPTAQKPLIAASIGPYGAYLADGSEYRGNYGIEEKELESFHRSRIQLLDKTNADLLTCETIPSFDEAKVLGEILKETNKPSWVSFSCRDDRLLNDSTDIEKAVAFFTDNAQVIAVGINCTHPKYITGLIQRIKHAAPMKKVVVYPNSGEVYNPETKQWAELTEDHAFVDMAQQWRQFGAHFIGGCCRIGPEQIKRLAASI
ncbi:MAG: homocysteine S-methyltransferase [Cytophagales bacterium]|nr:homocysteine S-methyltransferase [Cytophagales bacterium]